MNKKIYKFFEYAYLAIFFIASFEVYIKWNDDRSRAYLFLLFAVVALFMFFFRRNFRQKMEKHKQNNQD